jgi:hypothetical protein
MRWFDAELALERTPLLAHSTSVNCSRTAPAVCRRAWRFVEPRGAMARQPDNPLFDDLHPLIYAAMAGLAVWLLISAWVFFDGSGYINLALVMVSVLFVMAIGIPFMLSRAAPHADREAPSDVAMTDVATGGENGPATEGFGQWIHGDLDAGTGRCRSWTAAIEILLPIAAVAFGMTAIGIVFLVAHATVHAGV